MSKFSRPSSSFRFSVRYYPASSTCSHKAGSKGGGGGEVVANTFLAMEGFIIRAIVKRHLGESERLLGESVRHLGEISCHLGESGRHLVGCRRHLGESKRH